MHRIAIAIVVVSALFVLGCPPAKDQKPADDGKAPPTEPVAGAAKSVAEVNGIAISAEEFEQQFSRTRDRFKQNNRDIPPALEVRLKENILRRLVEDELIAQKAKAEGVALTDEEFEARFAEHRKRFGTQQAYDDFLKRTNQTEDQLRGELKKSLLRERLYSKLVPDAEPAEADIKAYYDQNLKRFMEPEQVQASHVLLSYKDSDPDPVKKEKLATCKKVLADAKKKGADFAELARKFSEGPTAPRGGDLGLFPRGRMVPPFEEAVFKAKPGQIVGPVETQFGCHVIKVVDKKPERQRPFDEVKASVVATLKAIKKSEQTRTLLNELRRTAQVKVLDPALSYQPPVEPVMPPPATPGSQPATGIAPSMPMPMPTPAPAPAPAPAPTPAP
ncbi:MAG: peptidylprolyl isomerase [Pseudomonadota bacterium]